MQRLIGVFAEVKRVLKDTGTLWVNIGDSYTGSGKAGNNPEYQKRHINLGRNECGTGKYAPSTGPISGLKSKNIIGIPWKLAFALQSAGWILRQDIIWHKTSCMPESVTDRCTKAHEYVFLLAKSGRYFFNNSAIKEPLASSSKGLPKYGGNKYSKDSEGVYSGKIYDPAKYSERNKRSVWPIATAVSGAAHFAVMPEELVKNCILAGSPDVEEDGSPSVILDPFAGSGTVGAVAKKYGRSFLMIDINPEYTGMQRERVRTSRALQSPDSDLTRFMQ